MIGTLTAVDSRGRMVYIIILNWNGWKDTVACLESVLRSTFQEFKVILCDNNSSDQSIEYIRQWARGAIGAECSNSALAHLIDPPLDKPIPFSHLSSNVDEQTLVAS